MRRYQARASGCADAKLHDISETGMGLMEGQSEQCRELPGQVLWVRQHIPSSPKALTGPGQCRLGRTGS